MFFFLSLYSFSFSFFGHSSVSPVAIWVSEDGATWWVSKIPGNLIGFVWLYALFSGSCKTLLVPHAALEWLESYLRSPSWMEYHQGVLKSLCWPCAFHAFLLGTYIFECNLVGFSDSHIFICILMVQSNPDWYQYTCPVSHTPTLGRTNLMYHPDRALLVPVAS